MCAQGTEHAMGGGRGLYPRLLISVLCQDHIMPEEGRSAEGLVAHEVPEECRGHHHVPRVHIHRVEVHEFLDEVQIT